MTTMDDRSGYFLRTLRNPAGHQVSTAAASSPGNRPQPTPLSMKSSSGSAIQADREDLVGRNFKMFIRRLDERFSLSDLSSIVVFPPGEFENSTG